MSAVSNLTGSDLATVLCRSASKKARFPGQLDLSCIEEVARIAECQLLSG